MIGKRRLYLDGKIVTKLSLQVLSSSYPPLHPPPTHLATLRPLDTLPLDVGESTEDCYDGTMDSDSDTEGTHNNSIYVM